MVLCLACLPHLLKAQTEPLFTQFPQLQVLHNPAACGTGNAVEFSNVFGFGYPQSRQTQNHLVISQIPTTGAAVVNVPVMFINASTGKYTNYGGAGVQYLIANVNGIETRQFAGLNLSLAVPMEESEIRVGVGWQNASLTIDGTKLRASDPTDPNLIVTKSTGTTSRFSAGVYYRQFTQNQIWAGVGILPLAQEQYKLASQGGFVTIKTPRQLFAAAGFTLPNAGGSTDWRLSPSLQYAAVLSNTNTIVRGIFMFQLMAGFKTQLEFGAAFRSGTSFVSGLLGWYPPFAWNGPQSATRLRLGYSCSTNWEKPVNGRFFTNEILLGLRIPIYH